MSDNRVSDLPLQPGSIGRKTGFQVTRTPRRGANGLEDPEDFFLSDDEFESQDISNTSPAKRLSVRYELEKGHKQELKPVIDTSSNPTLDRKDPSHGVSKIVAEISHNIFADSDDDKDLAEEDIDEVIKKAEKIGTPIKVIRRTLTSIDGSPGVKNPIVEQASLQSMRKGVLNGAKLTKSIALNKTNDSMFQPQLITNAPQNEKKVPELTSSENESNDTIASNSSLSEEVTSDKKEMSVVVSDESSIATVEKQDLEVTEKQKSNIEINADINASDKGNNDLQNETTHDSKEAIGLAESVETTGKLQDLSIKESTNSVPSKIVRDDSAAKSEQSNLTKSWTPKRYKEVSDADLFKELSKKGTSPITPRASRVKRLQKKSNLIESENISHLVPSDSEDESDADDVSIEPPAKPITPKLTKKITKQPKKTAIASISPVRRSTRTRVPPVARWKNEKIVYKTEKINGVIVKSVTDVQHVENIPATKPRSSKKKNNVIDLSQSPGPVAKVVSKKTKKPLTATTKPPKRVTTRKTETSKTKAQTDPISKKREASKKTSRGPSFKRRKQKASQEQPMEVESELEMASYENEKNPKTIWQTREDGALTLSLFEGPGTEKQVERTVAFAPNCYKNVTLIKSEDEHFKVGTLFDQDSEFCGGGIIELPPGSKKAVKSNHDTYFIFYVICGEVEVTLSRNTFVVTEGCSFEIPMGNYYQFINMSNKVARMMFVQSKYVVIGAQDEDSDDGTLDSEDDQ